MRHGEGVEAWRMGQAKVWRRLRTQKELWIDGRRKRRGGGGGFKQSKKIGFQRKERIDSVGIVDFIFV